jgi:hypothetical protein
MGAGVFYAYRISRSVGTFWAWSLLIVAFSLFALRNFTTFAFAVSIPPQQLDAGLSQFSLTSYWPGALINETAYLTLMVSMFGLDKIFRMRKTTRRRPLMATTSAN